MRILKIKLKVPILMTLTKILNYNKGNRVKQK